MLRCCRIQLGVLSLCWLASVASSSTTVDKATLRSMGLSRKEIKEIAAGEAIEEDDEGLVEEEVDEEESWKSKDDWWKDPLSMFSDDEEEEAVEEIDESLDIIEEAESLGENIVEEEEDVEEAAGLLEDIEEPEATSAETPTPKKFAKVQPVEEEEIKSEPVEEAKPVEEKKIKSEPVEEAKPVEEKMIKSEPAQEVKLVEEKKIKSEPAQEVKPVETRRIKSESQVVETRKPSGSTGTQPLALLIPLLPKLQSALKGAPAVLAGVPVIQLAASAVVAKFCIDSVKNKRSNKKENDHDEYFDDMGDEDVSEPTEIFDDQIGNMSDGEEDEQAESSIQPTGEARTLTRTWMQGVADRFARVRSGQRLPPARDLQSQVDALKMSLSKVESERDTMEKEYEKTSSQVRT